MARLQDSHLYQEIHAQPEVLRQLLARETLAIEALAQDVRERQIGHIVIAARGTSDNAGRYAQYLLGAQNGLSVGLATPSLFSIYQQPPRFGNALVLGISQSGKSPDIVAVLAEARRQGALTAAITNFPNSDLAQHAAHVIALGSGLEQSVAATKTYTAELAALARLSVALQEQQSNRADQLAALMDIPAYIQMALTLESEIARVAQRYRYMAHCVVVGRGYNYATAFELALKLKELTYTIVEPYSSADFLHGPMAVIEPGFPVLVVAPRGAVLPELQSFIHQLQSRAAEVLVISDDTATLAQARIALPTPPAPEWLSPLVTIIPGQLFAMHLAHARDFDVDRPRGLRKITETR